MYSQSSKILLIALAAFVSATLGAEVPVTFKDVPHFVQIKDQFGGSICVGALVSPTHVVSTAQCVGGWDTKNVFVVFGAPNRHAEGEKYEVQEILVPADYTIKPRNMDIAVVKLSKAVTGDKFRPIDLCSKSLKKNDEIEVTGYGAGGEFWGNTTDPLNRGTYTVIPYEDCAEIYAKQESEYESLIIKVTDTTFCADEYRNIVGEHGGPAVHDGELCGIVASGAEGYPGVFTDIYAVKAFIEKSIKG